MDVTVLWQLRFFGLAFRLGGFAGDLFGKRGKPLFDGGGVSVPRLVQQWATISAGLAIQGTG